MVEAICGTTKTAGSTEVGSPNKVDVHLPSRSPMSNIASEQLAMTFVNVADTLVDEFDVIEFLEMVTS